MKISVVADASVWVSHLRTHDINHEASRQWIEQYLSKEGHFVATTLLLIEVAAAISRRTNNPAIARGAIQTLREISSVHLVSLNSVLVQASIDIAADLQLRTGDATYVAVANLYSIALVSWDKEQLQRARSLIPTYTPENFPL